MHVFGWRARVLLTLYLKREQNLTHDAVLLMWHFLCMGIFTHQASAVRRRLRLLCGCYSEAVLPSNLSWAPLIYCCLIGYRTFSPTLIYVLTEQEPQYSQQLCKALGYFFPHWFAFFVDRFFYNNLITQWSNFFIFQGHFHCETLKCEKEYCRTIFRDVGFNQQITDYILIERVKIRKKKKKHIFPFGWIFFSAKVNRCVFICLVLFVLDFILFSAHAK